ncbi:hypothetical protein PLICRDRAFT_169259 [Plicaturopsis crispa FD-325 SS-3]|nr:hypothetical protein PLICRDRAFT_169259 [Plicaturopsis crispa FD-325 SS-3]
MASPYVNPQKPRAEPPILAPAPALDRLSPVCQTQPAYASSPPKFLLASHAGTADNISDQKEAMQEELAGTIHVVADDSFFKHILGMDGLQRTRWTKFFESNMLDTVVTRCMLLLTEARGEEDSYVPFSKLFNRILALARHEDPAISRPVNDLMCIRNDPIVIRGSPHDRKPDCILISEARLAQRRAEAYKEDDEATYKWKAPVAPQFALDSPSGVCHVDIHSNIEFRLGPMDGLYVEFLTIGNAHSNRAARAAATASSPAPPVPRVAQKATASRTPSAAVPAATFYGPKQRNPPAATGSRAISRGKSRSDKPTRPATGDVFDVSTAPGLSAASSNKRHADSAQKNVEGTKRRKMGEPHASLTEQSARGAVEILSSTGGTRVHAWGIQIHGSLLWISRYDASGIMQCQPVDILLEFPKFATLMLAMSMFDRERWGVQMAVKFPDGSGVIPTTLTGATVTFTAADDRKHTATITEPVFSRHGLTGRTTNVHAAKCETLGQEQLAIKFAQPITSRGMSEIQILDEAKKSNVPHMPEVYGYEVLPPMSKGVRGKVYAVPACVSVAKKTYWTSPAEIDQSDCAKYDDREFTVLVTKLYEPLKNISKAEELQTVLFETVWGHHVLYKKARILHRDISDGNIMFWRDAKGTVHGILNDFDNAIQLNENYEAKKPIATHRTGTLPYLAIDLLYDAHRSFPHRYRHDVESFVYVFVAHCVRYPVAGQDESERNRQIYKDAVTLLEKWYVGSMEQIRLAKSQMSDLLIENRLAFSPQFASLRAMLSSAAEEIENGQFQLKKKFQADARKHEPLHKETLFGFSFRSICTLHPDEP